MKALVTGGGGFLGSAIVRQLIARGDKVLSFSRQHYEHLQAMGCLQIRGDLADEAALKGAVAGCELVFHVAARAGIWGPYDSYYEANVIGTRNVLKACRHAGISRLVYTSSPSVVFDGRDQIRCDENTPYPSHFLANYPATKAQAEREVLAASDANLATVALRPHLIWGPGDNHLVPRIIERGQKGKLRLVGDTSKLVDSVYVDNAADAHLLAAQRLDPGAIIAGKAYFITNDEPLPLRDLINGILAAANLPPVHRRIPSWLAYGAGLILEGGYRLMGRTDEPILTRFVARQLATAHYYNIDAAKRDLGYRPAISIAEGLARLRVALNPKT